MMCQVLVVAHPKLTPPKELVLIYFLLGSRGGQSGAQTKRPETKRPWTKHPWGKTSVATKHPSDKTSGGQNVQRTKRPWGQNICGDKTSVGTKAFWVIFTRALLGNVFY
jgi:hypothetical protein